MSKEAMKLALEALERCVATCFDQYAHEQVMSRPEHFVNQTITALREALAEQPAQQEPLTLEQERKAFEEWIDNSVINKGHAALHKFSDRDAYCIDEIQNKWKAWKERAKRTSPPAQHIPDAIHHTDTSEPLMYIQGWNDCRAEMLEMTKNRSNT